MVGREVDRVERRRRRPPTGAKEVVRAKGLRGRELDGVDLVVREGEIVGVTGLPGSGASELVRQLANPGERSSAAQVSVAARGERRRASRDSHRGEAVALVPDDRLRFGVLPAMSVAENLSLANLDLVSRAGRMMPRLEREFTRRWVEELEIRCSSPASLVGTLSGGNQQKVVIGRCLATEPRLLLLMEPTAGVDVGTRHAIYALVDERSAHGMGVLVTSTDAADLVALCDRVLVLSRGRVVRELVGDEVSQERILASVEEVAA
jgi:ribose transport system ATP-binding protein